MDDSIDISGLSPEKKRGLLSQLLMEEAEESASVYPLSYGQRSMWFIHKLAPASAAYTVRYAARISGELDVPALERAAQALVDRHPMLRTTYAERDGQPVQLVHMHWPVRIAWHHLGPGPVDDAGRNGPKRSRAISPGEPELDEWIRRETDRPFDLYTGPVLRLTLLERTREEHVLLLVLHHIAVDFWSIDVILDELRMLYAAEHGAARPPVPAESFVDYAEQQTRMLAGAEGEDLWAYWHKQLAGDLPILQLPTDRPRPAVQTYPGTVHRFTLDDTVTAGLRQLGRSMGTTPYMTLLAAYATGQPGTLPADKTGLSLSRRGVLVTCFGPDPYSDRTLLRVWEQAGQSGSVKVKLPSDFRATRAVPVNLRGEPAGDAVKIKHGTFTFDLGAFAPASFRLE